MAFVVMKDHTARTMTHKQAVLLDKVMRGLINGSPKQQAFAKNVSKIYFSRQHEPELLQPTPDVPVPDWWQK